VEFIGFGRSGTDDSGYFWFQTIKPGRVPFDSDRLQLLQAPHLGVIVHARGLLNHLLTRIYFAGDPANETDPVLERVPPERRETLLARPLPGDQPGIYTFNIILQGTGETAFFNL
jgi:protocatechuate 3,4-dioxygenase alpha subunit